MGVLWPSLGRWTSRRDQSSEDSLEPLRNIPAGRATTTTVCYSQKDGKHHAPSSHFTPYDETSSSSSAPTDENEGQPPTGAFEVRAQGVKETEALLGGESSHALLALLQRQKEAERRLRSEWNEAHSHYWTRAISFAWNRWQEKTASQQKQQRCYDHENHRHHHYHQSCKDAYPKEECDETKEVNSYQHEEDSQLLDRGAHGANARHRSETQRKSMAGTAEMGTERVPRLPCLCFSEFGMVLEEAGGSSVLIAKHEEDVEAGESSDESPTSKENTLSCLDDVHDEKGCGQECPERPTRGGLDMYRPTADEFEGWQMDEELEAPHGMSYGIPRPATGLGWYDDELSTTPTVDHFDSQLNKHFSGRSTDTIALEPRHLPVRKDSLQNSPLASSFSQASSLVEVGDTTVIGDRNSSEPTPSMGTVIDNTNNFLQSDTEDDDWLGPKPVEWGSVLYDNVECSCNPLLDDREAVSPTSSRFSPISSEEEEIDDLFDIYATSSDRDPLASTASVQESDLPPYPPYHPSALAPLLAIARGLSLPPTTSFPDIQEHLARNANILRYLVLHCIPSPSTNPIEHATDLVEPILPPPLSPHPSFAQNYPQHPRRREYTCLLQAIRSVRWSADAINDMLAVIDFNPPPPGRGRPSTALPMFRKLRAADAQRKGCLTSAQLHTLHCHGVSLLDVLQMNDISKVVSCGLGGRLVEAAESGALGIARECNLLDEEGALLELLADPDDSKSPGSDKRWAVGQGSRLRNCVDIDENEGEEADDESEGYDEKSFVESFVQDGDGGHGVDDMPYTVSPLSPDATPGEHSWDQQEISPLTTSYRIQAPETLFHEVRTLSSTQQCQTDETTPDQGRISLKRTHRLRTCGDRRGVLVDEETAKSPEMRHFFHEIGAAPVIIDSDVSEDLAVQELIGKDGFGSKDSQNAPGNRTSWGVDLGGMLTE
ncbi:uncharacterized protein ColSpa_02074 [Colletotrichum spaethianum]|uniref:Uncharacterized protein n=1 Tax=Colletotrichum spaethianum TaxID=700344 RepID=A0AA37L4S1_9PEZI|nr:uncharacterized protein ColSpa_02074 [Colletotrichum spaethianum]GKT41893.1 hypothetical protein ColSpa_02074 [Colletotrichum spaethianum]